MDQFVKFKISAETTNLVRISSVGKDEFAVVYEVVYGDICLTTKVYQMSGYPDGFTFIEANTGLQIDKFKGAYNQLSPIYRSILHDKIPNLVDVLNNSMKSPVDEGDVFLVKGERGWNMVLPFYIDLSNADLASYIANASFWLALFLVRTLISIKTQRIPFIDLASVYSDIAELNSLQSLQHIQDTLPDGVMD